MHVHKFGYVSEFVPTFDVKICNIFRVYLVCDDSSDDQIYASDDIGFIVPQLDQRLERVVLL